MKKLTTKRMVLRPLTLDDAPAFFAYAHKPNIGPMAGWPPHRNMADSLKVLKMLIHENDTWGITLKHTKNIIGTVGLHARDVFQAVENTKELGYAIDDLYWGQGLVKEAADAIIKHGFLIQDLDTILCGHYDFNYQSKRVIEKLGFTYAYKEQKKDYKGDEVTVMMYKLTKQEYMERGI